jgi:alkylation response protein AidB-like acyl-CoA dehydrogenase
VDWRYPPEAEAFRAQLRGWLDEHVTDAVRGLGQATTLEPGSARLEELRAWNRELADAGYAAISWPVEYGGRGAGVLEQVVWNEELHRAGAPGPINVIGIPNIAPALMEHGTVEQRTTLLPRMRRGDDIWCQGFSEPDAGSDLASLRTKAIRDGDEYIVNGQKIWTSYASEAEFCYLLVRTGATEDRGKGISVLLVPTSTPGFDIHRVGSMVGEHSFHQLFFSDMRVPVSCRLGPENGGWDVVREALAFERVGAPRYARAALLLDEAVEWMAGQRRPLTGELRERVVAARAACEAARVLVYRVIDERARLLPASPHVYLARAAMVQAERLVGGLLLDIYGLGALEVGSAASEHLRKSMTAGLAGGSYEMQLNLISRLLLHLPKG